MLVEGKSTAQVLEILSHSTRNPGEVFARLKPTGVKDARVQFQERGPHGLPAYRIDGAVMIGPFPVTTFLSGAIETRDGIACAPGQPLGFEMQMDFGTSDPWIQENTAGVVGILCTESAPEGVRVTLTGSMREGPNYGGLRAPTLKNLLASQIGPLLRAALP